MYEPVEKTPEQKSQSVANVVSQRKNSKAPTSRFVDNRPEAIQMRRLRGLAKNSPQNAKLRDLHHLAAANNVKQGFGFVDNRPEAIQRKLQNLVNNSPEKKQLGNLKKSVKPGGALQLRSALGMAGLGGAAGDGDLYNIAGAVNLPQGEIFTENLPAAPDTGQAIDQYIARATIIGGVMAGHEFLDKNSQPPDIPNATNFGYSGHVFHANFEDWAQLAPGTSHRMGYPAALTMRNNLVKNVRNTSRNNPNIGLIDPFITRITIPQAGAANWVFETNWSEAANSYITKVSVGSKNLTGKIKDAGNYNDVEDLKPYAQQFEYSSAHDIGTDKNVGEQIEGLRTPNYTKWGSPTNKENHSGFDAVTKLAAEGARFVPVRDMGTNLKQNSRFFTTDGFEVIRYLSFQEMYANWGSPAWFNRQYGIEAPAVAIQVGIHGKKFDGMIDLNADFDLTNNTRAITQQGPLTVAIQAIINHIDNLQEQRSRLIGRKTENNARHIDAQLKGINARIFLCNTELKPYNKHYPTVVNAVRYPAPPPPIVVNHPIRDFLIQAGKIMAVGAIVPYAILHKLGYFTEEG